MQPRARQDPLVADVAEAGGEVGRQLRLQRATRREVRMAAFRGKGTQAVAVPEQAGLAQPRAGGDQGGVAGLVRGPGVEDGEVMRLQRTQPVCIRFEVVEQRDRADAQRGLQVGGAHLPGQVRRHHAPVADRPGDTQANPLGLERVSGLKFAEDRGQPRIGPAEVGTVHHLPQPRSFRHEEGQARLGPADVTGQEHAFPPWRRPRWPGMLVDLSVRARRSSSRAWSAHANEPSIYAASGAWPRRKGASSKRKSGGTGPGARAFAAGKMPCDADCKSSTE